MINMIDEEAFIIPRCKIVPYDAMVVMRAGKEEMAFVLNKDMTEQAFIDNCAKLRQLVFAGNSIPNP